MMRRYRGELNDDDMNFFERMITVLSWVHEDLIIKYLKIGNQNNLYVL